MFKLYNHWNASYDNITKKLVSGTDLGVLVALLWAETRVYNIHVFDYKQSCKLEPQPQWWETRVLITKPAGLVAAWC